MLLQMVCYMKYLPDPIWRTRSLRFKNGAHTNLHRVPENNKINGNKLKSRSFNNTFFTHLKKQNAGVLGWPLKLLQSPYSKLVISTKLKM